MLKIPVKRLLIAAAAASSLAAVVAPQAASAAEVRCGGLSSCETATLLASQVRYAASARGFFNLPALGAYEVRRRVNGVPVRVKAGYFVGSTSGSAAGPFGPYSLRVSSMAWGARVTGRLWTP